MMARPRLGDGFRRQLVPGVADGRSEVVDLSASASVPYGEWSDLLATWAHSGHLTYGEAELLMALDESTAWGR